MLIHRVEKNLYLRAGHLINIETETQLLAGTIITINTKLASAKAQSYRSQSLTHILTLLETLNTDVQNHLWT